MAVPYYFEPLDDIGIRFRATSLTAGPWDPAAQHGGPPAALLTRALEACAPRPEMMFGRVTCEILGPMPVDELTVAAQVLRPGRRVEQVGATLSAAGRPVMTAVGWRITRTEIAGTPTVAPPGPPAARDLTDRTDGYLASIEWAPLAGSFAVPGPSKVWTRMRGQVVAGEEPSSLQRLVTVADSGNGMSGVLDMATHYFINPELTVHSFREVRGEWVLLDAATAISTGGIGLARSVLSDLDGEVGRGAQSLLVATR